MMSIIDSFDEFMNRLSESYDSPLNIKWVEKTDLNGFFECNKIIYKIDIIYCRDDVYTFKFSYMSDDFNNFNTDLKVTKPYDKMKILATIRNAMVYFIEKRNPSGIIFAALDNSKGRKKLYNTYSKEISNNYNYSYKSSSINNKTIFILYKDINLEIIQSIISDIIEDII